jgi:hypothetical protein
LVNKHKSLGGEPGSCAERRNDLAGYLGPADLLHAEIGTTLPGAINTKDDDEGGEVERKEDFHAHRITWNQKPAL